MRVEKIGNATLYLGDALEVMASLDANSVGAVITDPPYSSGGRQSLGSRTTIAKNTRGDSAWFSGDTMGHDSYAWFMRQIAMQCGRICTDGSMAFVFTDWRQYSNLTSSWESASWTLRSAFTWDKNRGGAMGSYWRSNHEWAGIFSKGKARPLRHRSAFNTWRGSKPQRGQHPTEKPLELMRYIINATDTGGLPVADMFMGSGTTGVAAIKEGRKFVGIEMNPEFFELACERISAAVNEAEEGDDVAA